jgi:hypothetical protein
MGTYISALLILLCSIGVTPVACSTKAESPLSPVNTWKGLVGIKQQEVFVPTKAATYYWPIDLKVCKEAETQLLSAVRAHKLALNAVTTGIETDLKTPALALLDFLQSKLATGLTKLLGHNLPVVNPSSVSQQACTAPSTLIPEQLACNIFKTSAKAMESGFQSSTDSKTLAGMVSVIAERVNSFQDHVRNLKKLWTQAKAGTAPAEFTVPLKTDCAAPLTRQCGANLTAEEQESLHSRMMLTGISKVGADDLPW